MKHLLIVVVLFYKENAPSNIFKFDNQDYIIIDNSECPDLDFKTYCLTNKIPYFSFPENPGLSFAYNFAANYGKINAYDWLLICDQDTYFPINSINIYNQFIKDYDEIKLFCPNVEVNKGSYMSPVKKKHYMPNFSNVPMKGIISLDEYAIINSGLLVNINAFLEVGGYNEKVWLDFADYQFIDRFSKKFDKGCVIDLTIKQSFSNEVQSKQQKFNRFKNFCSSLKHYKPNRKLDKFWIYAAVLKRTLSLSISYKSFKPITIMIKNYLF